MRDIERRKKSVLGAEQNEINEDQCEKQEEVNSKLWERQWRMSDNQPLSLSRELQEVVG
ncbi:MAG: hypothetical protein H7X94_05560 [Vallitaleaceae bacterium]|nr:hypothetical protein [Vallitaleaceae bacterium]